MGNSCLKDVWKVSVSGKAVRGYVPLPRGPPADFICLWNTSTGWGQREGPAVRSPEVFSLAVECFRCVELFLLWLSKGSGYSRNRKVPQTIWQHMALAGAAAAAASCCCRALLSVARREYIQLTVCVHVCVCFNNGTISRWWRFDWADVAYVSLPSFYC